MKNKFNLFLRIALSLVFIFACAAVGMWYFTGRVDASQRAELLKQTKYAALLVQGDQIPQLTATSADLSNPAYIQLKNNLMAFREINPNIRFVYIMGYRPEIKSQFFYVDSEPEASDDYSPPGQIFPDTDLSDVERYQRGESFTRGPYSDSWGEWVSSFVPLYDSAGSIIGMIGIDIATTTWYQEIAFIRSAFVVVAVLISILVIIIESSLYKRQRSYDALRTENVTLQKNDAKLQEIQSMAQLGKIVMYFTDKTVLLDSQFSFLYGSQGPRLPMLQFRTFIHPDDQDVFDRAIEEMKAADTKFSWFDVRIGTSETGFHKYHFYGNVERSGDGIAEKFSGIMQDIADIR